MKLCLSKPGAFAILACALACGCSAGTQGAQPAATPSSSRVGAGVGAVVAPETPSTTQLMFAELGSPARPAPKVGKAHLVLGEDLDGASASEPSTDSDELRSPKEARRSDGSRRGGHFGTTK
jgi:hypothetical protein